MNLVQHPRRRAASRPAVLLAEDDDDLRFVLADLLDAEGFDTIVAGNGRSAVEGARARRLFAAVVDLNLPGLAGGHVVEALRSMNPALRILVMSGHHGANVPTGTRLLCKPFRVDDLLAALRA